MNFLTQIVMEGDRESANLASERLKAGDVKPEELVWLIGSYARFQWAVENCSPEYIKENLMELWVGSDPDDSCIEYLKLFKAGDYIEDLPEKARLRVYRGQEKGKFGISWTLDKEVAEMFAQTGGGRGRIDNGEVISFMIDREKVIAYSNKRNEKEVILDITDPEIHAKMIDANNILE